MGELKLTWYFRNGVILDPIKNGTVDWQMALSFSAPQITALAAGIWQANQNGPRIN